MTAVTFINEPDEVFYSGNYDHELEPVQHFLNCNCAGCRELFDQDEENALNPDPEVMGEQ